MVVLAVAPERLALDGDRGHLLGRREDEDVPEALALQSVEGAPQVGRLATDHVRAEITVGTDTVALLADALREVKNDSDRQAVILPRQGDKRAARLRLHIGRIDDGQPSGSQALSRN